MLKYVNTKKIKTNYSFTSAISGRGKNIASKIYIKEMFCYGRNFEANHFTLAKEALIEIGCVVTSLVGWLVVTRVHCGQTAHPRPIVTMEH